MTEHSRNIGIIMGTRFR